VPPKDISIRVGRLIGRDGDRLTLQRRRDNTVSGAEASGAAAPIAPPEEMVVLGNVSLPPKLPSILESDAARAGQNRADRAPAEQGATSAVISLIDFRMRIGGVNDLEAPPRASHRPLKWLFEVWLQSKEANTAAVRSSNRLIEIRKCHRRLLAQIRRV
jgi:hypothetical protein